MMMVVLAVWHEWQVVFDPSLWMSRIIFYITEFFELAFLYRKTYTKRVTCAERRKSLGCRRLEALAAGVGMMDRFERGLVISSVSGLLLFTMLMAYLATLN